MKITYNRIATEQLITHDGDTWQILATGAERDGRTYCHLKSTTRGRKQRNGRNPLQRGEWIETSRLQGAAS
jgi:hypothetical protein